MKKWPGIVINFTEAETVKPIDREPAAGNVFPVGDQDDDGRRRAGRQRPPPARRRWDADAPKGKGRKQRQ